jgi:hypothetical protein
MEQIQLNGKWNPFPNSKPKKLMSTVGSVGPNGFHSRSNWCIGCRWSKPTYNSCWGNPLVLPKIIFVACNSFKFFYNKIYPFIPNNHK